MSSKSIYSLERTNKNLSDIFATEYVENLYSEINDWSELETISSFTHPLFSRSYRNHLLEESKILNRIRSKKNTQSITPHIESNLREINKQIGYLTNRFKESSNKDHMIEIRKLRKAKSLLLKNKK